MMSVECPSAPQVGTPFVGNSLDDPPKQMGIQGCAGRLQ